ncbi:efflux RND transporter periplasmic adaptor subunit [soil metagenome]
MTIRDTADQDVVLNPTRARSRRRIVWIVGGLVVAAIVVWLAMRVMAAADGSVSASRLVIADVERGPFVRDISGEGKVVAAVSPTLYAQNAGAATLKVQAGEPVKRGQVLCVIDSPELNAKVAQERSNADSMHADFLRAEVEARQERATLASTFENARIDHTTARNDLDRQQKAFDAGAVAGMQVDHAKDTLEKARIALAQAEAGRGMKEDSLKLDVRAKQLAWSRQQLLVQDLERQVEELSVKSPVDGQVGQLFIAERANVARDAKLLSVIDLSALEVQMKVPESFARELDVGMPGEVSGNNQTWAAHINAISPEVVANEVEARLRFDGQTPGQLHQNQRLSVKVSLDHRDNVLTVRRGSFVDESGGQYAYVIRDGVAQRTPIRVGARSFDKVEILQGLEVGDHVVVSGADAFRGAAQMSLSR